MLCQDFVCLESLGVALLKYDILEFYSWFTKIGYPGILSMFLEDVVTRLFPMLYHAGCVLSVVSHV